MEMMLQTQNLCKYFRKQKAVNNVSLNIEKGQMHMWRQMHIRTKMQQK